MKKVIVSKPTEKPKCFSVYPRRNFDCPNPLISNNWLIRNDSCRVNDILQSDFLQAKLRKPIEHVPEQPHSQPTKSSAHRKQFKSSNTCYCKEKSAEPTLIKRPNKCLSLEEFERQMDKNETWKSLSKARASLHCFCKGVQASGLDIDLTDKVTLKKIQEELEKISNQLAITSQRQDYELYREREQDRYLKEIEDYEESSDIRTIVGTVNSNSKGATALNHCENLEPYQEIDSAVDSRQFKTKGSHSKATGDSYKGSGTSSSTNLKKFRDDNYFETHLVDECRDVPEHVCVHQYRLDERLLPQAVSLDRAGKSRCIVCNKPMLDKSREEKSIFNDRITRKKIRNLSKCLELGLAPHEVHIGNSERVQLIVNTDDYIKYGRFIGSYERPCHVNTYALRQQKMTCWRSH